MLYLIAFGGTAVVIATAVFAWFKGDPAVRWGAVINLVGYASITMIQLAGTESLSVPMVWADLLIAVGFLWLAIRYNSLWLGVTMMLQGAEFAIHTLYLVSSGPQPRIFGLKAYALGENLVSLSIILTLVGATLASIWRRNHPRTEDDDHLWETAAPLHGAR
jgi:hypothetical protein